MRTTDPKTPRTPAHQALIALREQLGGISQQELAVRMGVAVRTVARWETARPPSGESLRKLLRFSMQHKCEKAANLFDRALGDGRRTGAEIMACDALLEIRELYLDGQFVAANEGSAKELDRILALAKDL